MKKTEIVVEMLVAFAISLFLIQAQGLAQGGVGIGINNYHITFYGNVWEDYTAQVGVLNPSNYDIDVRVSVDCKNCVSDAKILGWKIGESIDDYAEYFTIDKKMVSVAANTPASGAIPVTIHFSPKLVVKKHLKVFTPGWLNFLVKAVNKEYDGTFTVPYLTLLIDQKKINGFVSFDVVGSTFGYMGVFPSAAATLEMTAVGMPFGSLVFILIIIAVAVFLVVRIAMRRLKALKAVKEKVQKLLGKS